ncbi:MAG: hypothetical protein K9N46_15190 [Candidatus Marinimicrobia bacterium]|nr:hypothetical protein [Candidatus Neomarinimicrobiota bacterium]MCF7830189.1 hypothetical protein [Candidatus Neomarinimicrobiota bacterium]MCF7882077.1 hypothetical protein [Candidatus Neomarinimicrobiota bacterium]
MSNFRESTSGSTVELNFTYRLDEQSMELFSESEWVIDESVLNIDENGTDNAKSSSSGSWDDVKELIPT